MIKNFTKLLTVAILLFGWANVKAQVFFINENFNTATVTTPPAGWTNNTLVGSSFDKWRFDNPGIRTLAAPISSPAAIFDSDNLSGGGGTEDVTLESPAFNTTGYAGVTLKFDQQFQSGFGGRGTAEVWDGTTWVQVYDNTAQIATSTTSVNITNVAANKTGVKVRFRWRGDFSWWWIVDNVQVFYAVDAQVLSIDAPSTPCGATNDSVKVTIRNNSAFTVTNVPVTVQISGIGIATSTKNIASIPASGTAQVAFSGTNTTGGGTLNVKAFCALTGDNNKNNDTLLKSINIVGTPVAPTVTGGAICGAGSVKLSANTALPSDSIVWYATNSTSGLPVGLQRTFTTPVIGSTRDYYAGALRGDASPKRLLSTIASGNGNTGTMFDIQAIKNVVVDSLSFLEFTAVSGTYVMRVYYKSGTFRGFEANPSAWTNLGDYNVTSTGSGAQLPFNITDVPLEAGKTYGFYITIISGPQTTLAYTNGANLYSDPNITISTGIGTGALFPTTFNDPRSWNGTVYYKLPGCISALVPVTATINPVAKGTMLTPQTGSKGTFAAGTSVSPDVTAVPDIIRYDLVTPTGFANASYGNSGTWVVSALTVKTVNGTTVPSSMYTYNIPTASKNGEFLLNTDTTFTDSIVCVEMNVRRLDNGCDTLIKRCIYVAARPKARFNADPVCKGSFTEFVNTSYLQAGVLKHEWNFGSSGSSVNTSDLANPFFTYPASGTYTVTLKVESDRGYRDSITQTVSVKDNPIALFEITNACEGTAVRFDDVSTLPTGTPSYSWAFGDGNVGSGKNTSHLYTVPNIYPVKLTVTVNGCSDVFTKYATQAPRSKPDFTFTPLQCDNADVNFSNTTVAPSFGSAAYNWNLGDGTTENLFELLHTYNVFATYNITLISRTDLGCADSISKSITLKESPKAAFTTSGSTCNGDNLTFNNGTNIPVGTINNTYEWLFGDAITSTDANPVHQYAGPGKKVVKLIARNSNGCESELVKEITIDLKPFADFVTKDVCLGEPSVFTNNSLIGNNAPLTYQWTINGTTSAAKDQNVTYASAGVKTVSLVTSSANGCYDSTSKTVEVFPQPTPVISIASQLSFDGAFSFATNTSGASYKWLFGDGATSTQQNVVYKYPADGRYIVRLVIVSDKGCAGYDADTLHVNRLGIAENNSLSNNVKIYPNPGNGIFEVEFDGIDNSDIKSVVVLNNLGQKVAVIDTKTISNNRLGINIGEEAAGIYFIQVETSNGTASFKYNLVK